MSPLQIRLLKQALFHENAEDIVVAFSSSGESCPACRSKEEILARTLQQESLILPGRFLVTYGATFQQTADIAGFNDAPYHEDLQKPPAERMVRTQTALLNDIPAPVAGIFRTASCPVSIIIQGDKITAIGYEDRDNDLFATSEVAAIRTANRRQKASGADTPWDLGGATLYTSTPEPGPMAYAECQWANVTRWIVVDHERQSEFATREAPDTDNSTLFEAVRGEYNNPLSAIRVVKLEPFPNRAQLAWKEKLGASAKSESLLYNGIKVAPQP